MVLIRLCILLCCSVLPQVCFGQNGCDHRCQAKGICDVRNLSNTCYYIFKDHNRTWSDAKDFCSLQGLSMVTPPKDMAGSKSMWLTLVEALKPFKSAWLGGKAKVFPEWSFINGVPLSQTALNSTVDYDGSGAKHGTVQLSGNKNHRSGLLMGSSEKEEYYICRFNYRLDVPSFYLSETQANWFEARSKCVELGYELLYLNSGDDTEELLLRLQQRRDTTFYIGLSHRIWQWQDGKAVIHCNWNTLEPNNDNGNENCLMMYSSGTWNDKSCYNQLVTLCQDGTNESYWLGKLSAMGIATVTLGVLLAVAVLIIIFALRQNFHLRKKQQHKDLGHTYDYIEVKSFSCSEKYKPKIVESDSRDSETSQEPPVAVKSQMTQPDNNITVCTSDYIEPRPVASTSGESKASQETPVAMKSQWEKPDSKTGQNTTGDTDKKCELKEPDCAQKENSLNSPVSISNEADVEEQTNLGNQCKDRISDNEYVSLNDGKFPDDKKDSCEDVPEKSYASLCQKKKIPTKKRASMKNVMGRWPWSK